MARSTYTTIYPETVKVRFHGRIPSRIHPLHLQGITSYPRRNHRRNRMPLLVLTFILGLLAGWVLRGEGAGLP
jgi:hypothetical protein